ncbi:MAG: hypothetical protein A2219_06355 [Elusimicrobia bacterium RIFOXYA2_FULL_50_26]|nr:MAG: hypothetical protein A2219_06355 [Elusimicrobia bacterium RIFOXYA2_FULL_50_26]
MTVNNYFIIIEWNSVAIRIARCRRQKSGAVITDLVEKPLTFSSDEEERKQVASALGSLPAGFGIQKYPVTLIAPRHQVFMRAVTLPPADERELECMLRFELEKYIMFPAEEATLGYYSTGAANAVSAGAVMLLAARTEMLRRYDEILRFAGATLERISVTSTAFQKLFSQNASPAETFAFFFAGDDAWEIDFFVRGVVVFSRSLRYRSQLPGEDWKKELANEISQSLAAFAVTYPGTFDKHIFVAGRYRDEAVASLAGHAGYEVSILKAAPLPVFPEGAAADGRFLSLAGETFTDASSVNLLPDAEKAALARRKERRTILRAAAIAGAIIAGAAVFYFTTNFAALQKNRKVTRRLDAARHEFAMLQKKSGQLAVADKFSADAFLPLEILRELNSIIPSNAYLLQLRYEREQSTLLIRGRTNSYAAVSLITGRMVRSPYFSHVAGKGARLIKVEDKNLVDFEIEAAVRTDTSHGVK